MIGAMNNSVRTFGTPDTVARQGPTLYGPTGRPQAADVAQGSAANCWLAEALQICALTTTGRDAIEELIDPDDNGNFVVTLKYIPGASGKCATMTIRPQDLLRDKTLPMNNPNIL